MSNVIIEHKQCITLASIDSCSVKGCECFKQILQKALGQGNVTGDACDKHKLQVTKPLFTQESTPGYSAPMWAGFSRE